MNEPDLSTIYRDYIACLNNQDWSKLGRFVHGNVQHNERSIGLQGYRHMLECDFARISDLFFNIQLLIAEPPYVASRLAFECTPEGRFLVRVRRGPPCGMTGGRWTLWA